MLERVEKQHMILCLWYQAQDVGKIKVVEGGSFVVAKQQLKNISPTQQHSFIFANLGVKNIHGSQCYLQEACNSECTCFMV